MPDSDRISIDNLTLAPDLSSNDVAPVVHTVNGVKSTYKATMTLLGTFLNKILEYSADLTTTNKTIIGAINEINAGGGGGGAVILYGTTAPASSLGSDGNLYVQYTAGTGGASDVVDALYAKIDGEWCEISTKQVQSDWSQSDNTKVDYIKNKPTIPAAQVNSDWNANSGVAEILNKPTIPTFDMSVSPAPVVDGATLQIPQSILTHKMVTIEVFRYGYCGAMSFYIEEITNGALGAGVQVYAYTGAKTFKVSNTGLITAMTGFGTDGLNIRITGMF